MSIKKNSKGFAPHHFLINRFISKNTTKKSGGGFTLIELERSKSVRRNEGFTLIELLVVSVIITILTAAILLNYKNTGQQFALQRAASKVAQDIRRAAEMAMSAQECPINKCGGPPAIIPSRYGIEFEKNKNYYILFADRNNNGTREPSDNIVETINLEEGIGIQALYSSNGGPFSSKDQLWVSFKPPDPVTAIRDPWERSSGRVELANTQNQTKTININAVGLIDID